MEDLWWNFSYNPLEGSCLHRCPYCYVERMKKAYDLLSGKYSGPITFNPKVGLSGRSGVCFVCSMNDIAFAKPEEQARIVAELSKFPDLVPVFLSKDPAKFSGEVIDFCRENPSWVGTSLENLSGIPDSDRGEGAVCPPKPYKRLKALGAIKGVKKWLSIEPAFEPLNARLLGEEANNAGVRLAIVGGLSGCETHFRRGKLSYDVISEATLKALKKEFDWHWIRLFRKSNIVEVDGVSNATPAIWKKEYEASA